MTTYVLHNKLPNQAAISKALQQAGVERRLCIGLDIEQATPAGAIVIGGGESLYLGKHPRGTWLALARWLIEQGCGVHVVQEACGFGWGFDRELTSLGARSIVIAPQEIGGKRKTDKRDARTLALLGWDYFVRGNQRCLRPVRAPSKEEQQRRGLGRSRSQWLGVRTQMEARGRSLMWDHDWLQVPKGWWRERTWAALREQLSQAGEHWLVAMLSPMQQHCASAQQRADELQAQMQQQNEPSRHQEGNEGGWQPARAAAPSAASRAAQPLLPKGLGMMSYEMLQAEVMDWTRFKNRGQAGSFIGCCPSERSSGGRQKLGEIDRIGSPRLRWLLVEAAWRLLRYNPGWRGFKAFGEVLDKQSKASGAKKRKAIVACARLLMIDLWRLHVGTATLGALGLQPAAD